MISHRTTARGTLVLALALLTLAGGASAAAPQKIVFPVLGTATYIDDFGQARAGGAAPGDRHHGHQAEPRPRRRGGQGRVLDPSASAGCMLYLHGASGTDYYYIHLNNDLTPKNDNRGKCVAGTAYAKGLKDGAKVHGRPARRLRRRLGRRERDPRAPALRAPPGPRRCHRSLPVAAAGDAPALLGAARYAVHARAARDDRVGHRRRGAAEARHGQRLADAPAPVAAEAAPARDRAGRRDGAARPEDRRAAARPPTSPRRSRSSRSASGRRPHRPR